LRYLDPYHRSVKSQARPAIKQRTPKVAIFSVLLLGLLGVGRAVRLLRFQTRETLRVFPLFVRAGQVH
jgi:hypothetical protein